jgi:lysophospholipase L1-like esterase
MNWLVWALIGLGILAVLLLSTGWWRYSLTGYLIAQVSPYEQVGEGAGRIMFIGDSTGYGTGASRSSDSVAGLLGNDYEAYTITNNSVNGRKIIGAMEVLRDLDSDNQYDLLVFQIGANDMLADASAQDTVDRMKGLIEASLPYATNLVILTCGNIGGSMITMGRQEEAEQYTNTSRQYDELMIDLVNEYHNVSFVPLFDEPEDDPYLAEPKKYTSIDGLHPTSAGYNIWYQKAKPYFDAVLDQRSVIDNL